MDQALAKALGTNESKIDKVLALMGYHPGGQDRH